MTTNSSTSSVEDGTSGGARPGSYYSYGIPYLPIDGYPGRIIAVEGTDGVGRCSANGSRCRATASSRPAGPGRS
jgi:hypothetical protein